MAISDLEATMENILPILVTPVMQYLEDLGKHPDENFTEYLRAALRNVVPKYPLIEMEVWDPPKQKIIVKEVAEQIHI